MITPRFSCAQTDTAITVNIYCPSVRASELDISIVGTLVTIHIAPYFLRLNFPGSLASPEDAEGQAKDDSDASEAHYDAGSGWLKISLTKALPGEHFPDLDMLPKLLAPKQTAKAAPEIEVLSSAIPSTEEQDLANGMNTLDLDAERREILHAAENDWRLPQSVAPVLHTTINKPYGFLDTHSGYFVHASENEVLRDELGPAVDFEALDHAERRLRRLRREEKKWDPEYYMADYADDEYIQEHLRWRHPYSTASEEVEYTEAENLTMLNLPRKEYIASPAQNHAFYLTLVTLLFGYTYDARTTQHDPTSESAWTICALVPAFAALDPAPYTFHQISHLRLQSKHAGTIRTVEADPEPLLVPSTTYRIGDAPVHETSFSPNELTATLATSYRRALVFPLYRSWALAEACKSDVAQILSKGKRTVIRCLLETKRIIDTHEVYYVFSKIWVDDFLVWVTLQNDDVVRALGRSLAALRMAKTSVGWDLEALESVVDGREADSDDESDDESDRTAPALLSH